MKRANLFLALLFGAVTLLSGCAVYTPEPYASGPYVYAVPPPPPPPVVYYGGGWGWHPHPRFWR